MLPDRPDARPQTQVIHIQPLAPAKPRSGEPCNGCGVCCLVAPCPLGIVLSGHVRGACCALYWNEPSRLYRCGALGQPDQALRQALPRWLHGLAQPLSGGLRRAARRWIAAGQGCDSTLQVQLSADITDNPATPCIHVHD